MPRTKKQPVVRMTLKVGPEQYHSEGKDLSEALDMIKPKFVKSLGFLTVERNGKSKTRMCMPKILNQLFGEVGRTTKELRRSEAIKFFESAL